MDKETGRVEAFSDGVFAIAITLLILEIKIPPAETRDLYAALLGQWPMYVAFTISFAFIGIMWINHHRLFGHIRRSDNTLLFLNLLLLFGVCIVPFPTAVLAQYLGKNGQHAAAILYCGTYFAIAIFYNLLWRYAAGRERHLLVKDVDTEAAGRLTRQYALGPVLYLVCTLLAWISVPAALIMNALLALFFALPPSYAIRHEAR